MRVRLITFFGFLVALSKASIVEKDCESKISEREIFSEQEGFINPSVDIFPKKGTKIVEDGFYDVDSFDFEEAFTSLVLNTTATYNGEGSSKQFSYLIRNYGNAGFLDTTGLDDSILEACMKYDSMASSNELKPEQLAGLFRKFLDALEIFKRIVPDEWLETSEKPARTTKKKTGKKGTKKGASSSSSGKTTKLSTVEAGIPFLKTPEGTLKAATLNHPICQRVLQVAVQYLSPEENGKLFTALPMRTLDNPSILAAIEDFSSFNEESGAVLIDLFREGELEITDAMARTLPIEILYGLLEVLHFDISFPELRKILQYRPNLHLLEPFISNHASFGMLVVDSSIQFANLPSVELIVQAVLEGKDRALESVLAYYIRSEISINNAITYLLATRSNTEEPSQYKSFAFPALIDLQGHFYQRQQLISVAPESIKVLLKTCTFPLVVEDFDGFWESLLSHGDGGEDIEFSSLLDSIKAYLPYAKDSPSSINDIYKLFESITQDREMISERFAHSRWIRNFIHLLIFKNQKIVDSELFDKFQAGLARHWCPIDLGSLGFDKFDWFIRPIEELYLESFEEETFTNISTDHLTRKLRKILYKRVDFSKEGVIEAFWRNGTLMNVLVAFPMALSQKHVDDLVSSKLGREMLKANEALLQRLPSFKKFTLTDLEEFNLALDDFAPQIGTLNIQVALEWFHKNEWIVNNRTRSLFRVNPVVFLKANPIERWSMVTFEAIRSDFELANNMNLLEAFDISPFLSTANSNLSLNEKFSLIARWMIHFECQTAWQWINSRIPLFYSSSKGPNYIQMFTMLQCKCISRIVAVLEGLLKKMQEEEMDSASCDIPQLIKLIEIIKSRTISSIIDNLTKSLNQYDQVQEDNDFLVSLIQNGPGSIKFKRVWSLRARILIVLNSDLKSFNETIKAELETAFAHGALPLDDALLYWFLSNRLAFERIRVKSSLRMSQNLPYEPVSSEVPYASFFNLLFNYA